MKASPRKRQIEEEAAALFRDKGYAASSMRDLAQVLGIEAASLYSHIKSKEEILRRICFRVADAFFMALNQLPLENTTAEEQLKQAIKLHLRVIVQNIDDAAVFFHEWRHLSEPHLSEFLKMRKDYEQRFFDLIIAGIKRKEFRPVDEKIAAMTLLSAINWTHRWYKPNGKMNIDQIGEVLCGLIIKGLMP